MVGQGRKGKGGKKMSWHFNTSVMTCAHFGVDISMDIGSGGSTILGSPSTSWLGLSHNSSTTVLL
jgi:hypothetical protein